MEQPELGSALIGCDAVAVTLTYRWEDGWSYSYATRQSGADGFRRVSERGLDAAEIHAFVSDHLALTLGLA